MDFATILKDILGSPVGSFAFVVSIVGAIVWVVHYVTKFVTKISVRYDSFKEETDKTRTHIDEIRKDLAIVRGNIEAAIAIKDTLTRRKSPVSLTDTGQKIVQDFKLFDIVAKNWDKITKATNDICSKNPYDLQEYFIDTSYLEPEKFFSDKDIDELKIISFKGGFTFMSIARVMGILIRDEYFKRHEINIDDIDKYKPAEK
ncbi:MAG: hypothetical protein LBD87_01085 [Prevotellaceae bacterium]|jgi:hypothetical protein|nr:hypothetical protein [Prevotellaceae bacterium]